MKKVKKAPATLDPSTARQVLLADLSNLLKKVRSGRTLTKYERQLVERCARQADPVAGPEALAVFASMKQCAGATGLSLRTLKAAKRAGCGAFKPAGRIDWPELKDWLADHRDQIHAGDNREGLELERLRLDVQRRRHDLDKDRRELVPISDVAASWQALTTAANSALADLLIDQSPPLLAGLAAEAIRVEMKRIHSRFCEIVGSERFTQEAQAKAQAAAQGAT